MNIDFFNNYKIGIDFIDKEHKELFLICDEAVKNITYKEKSLELITEFNKLITEHFKNEEKYMEDIEYPYIKYHKEAHSVILSKLAHLINKDFTLEYNKSRQEYLIKMFDDTLLKHTDHFDRQITDFLNSKVTKVI